MTQHMKPEKRHRIVLDRTERPVAAVRRPPMPRGPEFAFCDEPVPPLAAPVLSGVPFRPKLHYD
jgi:hypothetical protein